MKYNKPVVIFTDYKNTPSEVASYLLQHGAKNRKVVVAENLTYPEERILETDLKSLSEKGEFGLCLMIIK
jgi:precorrin-6B methylase 1